MLFDLPVLSMITFSPIIGIGILLLIPHHHGKWIRLVAIAATLVPLLLAAWLYVDFSTNAIGYQYAEQYSWLQIPLAASQELTGEVQQPYLRLDYVMAVDGVSLPLVFLTTLMSTVAALASRFIKKRWKTYYILLLLLEMALLGVFMAQELFLFFVFLELTVIPLFLLTGIWGYMQREKAANTLLIYNGLGSALLLAAFLILIATAGFVQEGQASYYTGHLGQIMNNLFYMNEGDSGSLPWVYLILLLAFGMKMAVFPFHRWMLKLYTEAPVSVVMLHSGIVLKTGAYGLIRFGVLLFPVEATAWASALAVIGFISFLFGALVALRQQEFKLLLAYSVVSHAGIILVGIAAFNLTGMMGAIYQMISHGLISALLFLLAGSIYERTETTELQQLGGLGKTLPFICGVLIAAAMASLGLPMMSGFPALLMVFLGIFESMKSAAIVGIAGMAVAAAYVLKGILGIAYGAAQDQHSSFRDARLVEAIPMIILLAFIILLGLYPAVLTETLKQTVLDFIYIIQSVASQMGG